MSPSLLESLSHGAGRRRERELVYEREREMGGKEGRGAFRSVKDEGWVSHLHEERHAI